MFYLQASQIAHLCTVYHRELTGLCVLFAGVPDRAPHQGLRGGAAGTLHAAAVTQHTAHVARHRPRGPRQTDGHATDGRTAAAAGVAPSRPCSTGGVGRMGGACRPQAKLFYK